MLTPIAAFLARQYETSWNLTKVLDPRQGDCVILCGRQQLLHTARDLQVRFIYCREHYKKLVACVMSDREICMAHPSVTAKECSQLVRRTEVTKCILSRNASECLSELSLAEVSDTVTSLRRLVNNKAALLGTSQNTLFIW